MQRDIEREKKLVKAWRTGRYKTVASMARVFRVPYNTAKRAIERAEIKAKESL